MRDSVIQLPSEEEVGGDANEDDGMMNEGDKSSTTRVTRTVLTDSGVV